LRYQILERVYCALRISGLYTSRLLDAACKKVLNLLKKGLLKVEATLKSAWTEKDQIDNFLKERRLMRSLESSLVGDYKMDSMHSTLSMYYDYDAHVKGELLVMMKNSQSVNLLIFISNTLIELFNDFGFDCDGIPERPTMYLNLWSYKVVRHRYSNLMIQPESEVSTQGYPLVSVEVLRFYTSVGNPVKKILLKLNLPDHRKLKYGGKVKEFQRSFNRSDTEYLSRSDEVLKLKNFKKDATLTLFKSTNQERYEHVGPKSQVSQDGKVH
ncbi:hypothetical protein Tco_1364809, partial [Tanacetum coccineum]